MGKRNKLTIRKGNKIIRELFEDKKFKKRFVEACVIAVLEFQLNWKHQIGKGERR